MAKEGVYIQIIGLENELIGDFAVAQINRMIGESVEKITRMVKIHHFYLHFKTHKKLGKKVKYSIAAKLSTNKGTFSAYKFGLDIVNVANQFFDALERGVIEKEKRSRDKMLKAQRRAKNRV